MSNLKQDLMNERKGNVRDVAAMGALHGSQGVPPAPFLQEIDANSAKAQALLREQVEQELRPLEGQANTLAYLEPQAREDWETQRQRHQSDPPQFLPALLFLFLAGVAEIADTLLLAPTLDMLGVPDPQMQIYLALGYMLAATGLLHLAIDARRKDNSTKWLLWPISAVLLILLLIFGKMRADELAFAAGVSGNPLARFLHEHPKLSEAVISLFSMLFPVVGALGLNHAITHLRNWFHFRKARARAERLKRQLEDTNKQVEAEKNRIEQQQEAICQRGEEWKASYLNHWHLGNERGVKKAPLWMVWVKALGVALLVFLLTYAGFRVFSAESPWMIAVGAGMAAGLLSGAAFYHRREHPTPEELLDRVNLQFRDGDSKERFQTAAIESIRDKQIIVPERPNGSGKHQHEEGSEAYARFE